MTQIDVERKVFGTRETPAGFLIEYGERLHRKRWKRAYWIDGELVPSVTEILDVLERGGLSWWGQGVAITGIIELWNRGILAYGYDSHAPSNGVLVIRHLGFWEPATQELIVEALKEADLTVNDVRDAAGDRGQGVHDAFQAWAITGETPTLDEATKVPEDMGFYHALYSFVADAGNAFVTADTERMVASKEFGYAGRYDYEGTLERSIQVVDKVYAKNQPKLRTLEPGRYLIDLKTGKDIYDTHALQLAGYELARTESGDSPALDFLAVLHLNGNGQYQFRVVNGVLPQDFLDIFSAYDAKNRAKEAIRA